MEMPLILRRNGGGGDPDGVILWARPGSCLLFAGCLADMRHAVLRCHFCGTIACGGQIKLHHGPQDAGGRLRLACCVAVQSLQRRAIEELFTATTFLDAGCSTKWPLRRPEDRGWIVSHGPEFSWHGSTCTLVLCGCEPIDYMSVNDVTVQADRH